MCKEEIGEIERDRGRDIQIVRQTGEQGAKKAGRVRRLRENKRERESWGRERDGARGSERSRQDLEREREREGEGGRKERELERGDERGSDRHNEKKMITERGGRQPVSRERRGLAAQCPIEPLDKQLT